MIDHHTQSEKVITVRDLILVIKNWLLYIRSKWILLLVVGMLGGVIGSMYAYVRKPIYTAVLTYSVEEEKSGYGGGVSGIANQLGIDVGASGGGNIFNGANLIELMKSRQIVEKTLLSPIQIHGTKTTLADYYINFTGLRLRWQKDEELKNFNFLSVQNRDTFSLRQNQILAGIYQNIVSGNLMIGDKDKSVSITSIKMASNDELFSKLFVENLISEVSGFFVETKTKKAKTNYDILLKQVDSVRKELNSAITGVAELNDNTFNLNSSMVNIKKVPSSKLQIDVQVNTTMLSQLILNLEMAKVNLRKETPLVQIIDSPILPLVSEKPSSFRYFILGMSLFVLIIIIYLIVAKYFREILK